MKWSFNHKSRKAFLTAAICLALSQSVFAMPTGGKVVDGTVTGITNGTVANGGTINVNSNALIDWTAFNIGNGETLNFKFDQDSLNVINHVTGFEMSQLLGTLNAKNGNVYLINPNGISVGGGARIDAGMLVLSTLDATDTQLQDVLKNGLTNLALTGKSDSKGITIENGANITVGPFLGLLGNKVQIADNVTISDASYGSGISKTNLVIAAANEAKLGPLDNDVADISSVTTGQGNTLTIGAANFNIKNEYTDTYFLGNDINMKGTNLNIESGPEGSALDIIAADAYAVNGNETVKLNFSQGNQLNLDNVKASADFMHVIGGKTSIADSDLTLTELKPEFKQGEVAPYMTVAALNGEGIVLDDIEGGVTNVQNTDGATLTIKDSNLTSNENIALWGGSVELTNANLKTLEETNAKNNNIDIDAFTSFGDKRVTTDSFNTVKVTGGSLESGGDISMRGAKIALDGVDKIAGTGEKSAVELLAGKKIRTEDPDIIEINGTENNTIDIKNTNITSNDGTLAYGGAVNIASSSLKDNNSSIQIAAANYYLDDGTLYTDGKDSGEPSFLASTNNGVTLDNAQLITSAKGPDGVNAIGVMSGNVTVKNKSTLDSGDIWLTAGKSYEDKNTTEVLSADSGMNLTVSDSTLKASEDATLVGANVGLMNTSLTVGTEGQGTTGTNGIVRLAAGQDVTLYDQDGRGFGIESANNTGDVSLNNVTMNALGEVDAYGKTIDIKDSNLTGNSTIAFSAGNATEDGVSSTVENTINLANTTVNTNDAGLALIGGKVNVTDKSNLTVGDLELVAGTSYTNDGNAIQGADATNLSISDSTMTAKHDATLIGANVDLKKTTLNVGTPNDIEFKANGAVRIAAAKDVKLEEDGQKGSVITEVNNTGNLTMTGTTLSTQGDVKAYGETVKLQDSALSTTNDKELNFNALNTYKRVNGTSDTWTATKDNTMDVTGTTLTNKGIIELSSGKLTMDKSNLTATGKEGAILVDARASYTDDDKGPYVNKATDGMDVNIKDSNFSGDNGVLVVGNTVTIDGQSSAKSANAKVFFATGQQSEMTDTSIKGNGAPVNVGKDVKYDAKNTEFAPGMKTIETKPTEPTKPDQPTTPTEPTEPTEPTKPDQPTTPTEPTEPTKPDKPIVTPDPKPAVDVKKNIEQGKQDMTKAIADNKDNASAAVKQQAEKLSDSKMTDEEKAAQVKGYAEAIEDSQASAAEKQALVKDTVKSFEPTQQSSIEAQNKQDESAQNSNAQTVIPNVTVKTVAPAAHEGAAATVTVDGTVVNE
ncbi:filamentous hemagglutinin N-terminal domain-containing protein [Mitsuokella multacida]|uniref:filamentous hemagglutinin N-terminal domain-containing protein n=1 Tax=Mitsuokella multacida TaxID=52226 RepID=UPI003F7DFDAD